MIKSIHTLTVSIGSTEHDNKMYKQVPNDRFVVVLCLVVVCGFLNAENTVENLLYSPVIDEKKNNFDIVKVFSRKKNQSKQQNVRRVLEPKSDRNGDYTESNRLTSMLV